MIGRMTGRAPLSPRARRRCGRVSRARLWLAVLALLINALLPPAISLAAAAAEPAALCRAAPHGGKSDPATAPRHCALCLAAVTGAGPLPDLALLPPPRNGRAQPLDLAALSGVPRAARIAALPRGPPRPA
jgi:hypothetical protein